VSFIDAVPPVRAAMFGRDPGGGKPGVLAAPVEGCRNFDFPLTAPEPA
jgi:hypothetical protein